jgi:hypothetical protein
MAAKLGKAVVALSGAVMIAMCSTSVWAQTPLAPGECEALKALVEQTPKDFALLLRGVPAGPDRWQVSFSLPGSRQCYIQKTKRILYVCGSDILPDGSDSISLRDERVEVIHDCLGPAWTKNTQFSDDFISLNDPAGERTVIVSVEKDSPFPRYYLSTQIARMNQLPLETPPQSVEQVRPRGYCDALKSVLADSHQEFSQSTQNVDQNTFPNRAHWRSNNQLPGWNDCFVHEWNGRKDCRYLTCGVGNVVDRKQSGVLMGRISSDIRSCLGASWRESRIGEAGETIGVRLVSRDHPLIELHPSKSLYSDAWGLDLQIGAQGVCPASR